MDLLEVAVRKLVSRLRVLRLLVVLPEVPLLVLLDSVLFDKLVLLPRRGLMFTPVVSLVENELSFLDEPLCVLIRSVVQLDCHSWSPAPHKVGSLRIPGFAEPG
jgi:hypothetical protein